MFGIASSFKIVALRRSFVNLGAGCLAASEMSERPTTRINNSMGTGTDNFADSEFSTRDLEKAQSVGSISISDKIGTASWSPVSPASGGPFTP